MMTKHTNLTKKVLASVLAGAALLTFAVTPYMPVSANDGATQEKTEAVAHDGHGFGHQRGDRGLDQRLEKMVNDGKITSDQATSLKKAMAAFHKKQAAEQKEFMDSLPDKTGISHDTLKNIFQRPVFQKRQNRLADLVKQGTVTQAEADSLQKFFSSHKPGSEGAPQSREEARAMMVKETGISSDRLDEIMKQMRPPMGPGPVIPQHQDSEQQ